LSKAVILSDPRYKDFEVTWSNEGYWTLSIVNEF
jgi:hypothetical protein